MGEILESARLFVWGWFAFVGSAFVWLLGKFGEGKDFYRLLGRDFRMPPRWALRLLAVMVLVLGTFFSFHAMRLEYVAQNESQEKDIASAENDKEALRDTIAVLQRQVDIAHSLGDSRVESLKDLYAERFDRLEAEREANSTALQEERDVLRSSVSALSQLQWVTDSLSGVTTDTGDPLFGMVVLVLPPTGSISPALLRITCDCEMMGATLGIFNYGGLLSASGPEYSDDRRTATFRISQPVISRNYWLSVRFGARKTPVITNVSLASAQ